MVCSVLCVVLMVLSGCGGSRHTSSFSRQTLDLGNVSTVAVLPFENFSGNEYAGEKMRRVIISELVLRGFNVIEPGEVTKNLRTLKVRSLGSMSIEDIREIGNALNIETLIMGSVGTYGRSMGVSVSYPEISIHLMVLNTVSGGIERSLWHTRGGPDFWTRHFGVEGKTLSEVERQVAREVVDELF